MEASELLSDTFEVLSSKEIKLLAMRAKPDKDLLMEEDDMALANVVMQEAQKKLISQVCVHFFLQQACSHLWASPVILVVFYWGPALILTRGFKSYPGVYDP